MMTIRWTGALLLLCTVGLCGCPVYWNHDAKAVAWQPQNEPLAWEIEDTKNQYNIKKLEKGMTTEDVYRIMGMPDLYAQYESSEDDVASVFYYYTKTDIDDGSATGGECTPLVISNGKLKGWGKGEYSTLKPACLK